MIVCTGCQQANESHFKFCLGCGAELPSSAAMPTPTTRGWLDDDAPADPVSPAPMVVPTPPAAAVAATQSDACACPSCGTVGPSSFTFCGQCGARMDAPPATLRTPTASTVHQGSLVLVRADGTEGGVWPLVLGENMIGRGTGPLFDADGYLSPHHAQIELGPDGGVVSDVGSLNGVFLRVTEEEELADRAIFRVGQELLRFEVLPPTEPLPDGTHIMGSPAGTAWGRLVLVVSPTQDGSAFPLAGEAIILGRERGDIVFAEDGYVSGTHARVSQRNGRVYLADLNSSNGTFIRLRGPRLLAAGALLLMGQQLFRVQYN